MNVPAEIIANIFNFLNLDSLANASRVCKLWRLEARRHIYKNRSEIIYAILKPHLDYLRTRMVRHLTLDLPLSRAVARVGLFRIYYGLDISVEFLAIKDELRDNHRKMKRACRKMDRKLEARRQQDPYYWRTEEFKKLMNKFITAETIRFDIYREFVNFRYFILVCNRESITALEQKQIYEALAELQRIEEMGMWTDSLDYWGDEDPDA